MTREEYNACCYLQRFVHNDYVMTLSNVNLWFVGMTKMGHSSGVHNIA